MAADRAIYDYILTSVVDGVLPEGFDLGDYARDETEALFADGAMDGVSIYHTAPPELPEDIVQTIAGAFERACAGDRDGAEKTLTELFDECRVVFLVEAIRQAVEEAASRVSAEALYGIAVLPILTSMDKEMVKLGLIVLDMFSEPDVMMKDVVRTLALSDEFTLFCAWCAQRWPGGNQELLAMARKVRGWGRVHLVAMLKPETDEVRDWLFREGVDNDVMPEYTARTCYIKAGVAERLAGEMSADDFAAATAIEAALVSGGRPVPGYEALDDPRHDLSLYVEQAARQELDDEARACLAAICDLARANGWDDLVASCEAVLGEVE